jgi:uncharacterized protein YdeI (BOF family)
VTVEGTVTTSRTLLDASGRRAIIEDGSGAIELYLEAPVSAIRPGVRVRVTGEVGRAWGAPRLRVSAHKVLGTRAPVPHALRVAPGAATEWRLVTIHGTVTDVHKDGDRWTADVAQGGLRLLVAGLAGSGIPSTTLAEGRTATITGIVKRPYPTATDRRYAIVPRSTGDIRLGSAGSSPSPTPTSSAPSTGSGPGSSSSPGAAGGSAGSVVTAGGAPPDVELDALEAYLGTRVLVGGLVTVVAADGFELDDGTSSVRVVLEGAAADLAGLVQAGDAVNATGIPDDRDGTVLVVIDPADLVLLGDLDATGTSGTGPSGTPTAALAGTTIGLDTPGLEPIDTALAGIGRPDQALAAAVAFALAGALAIGLATWMRYRSVVRTRRRIAVRLARIAGAMDAPQDGPAPG